MSSQQQQQFNVVGSNPVQNCMVIGGAGFLGQHLVEDLMAKGYNVSVMDIREPSIVKNVKFYKGDICDKETVLNAFRDFQVDTVFHTATPDPFKSPSHILYKVNVEGTRNLMDCLIQLSDEVGKRKNFVLVSSASVVFDGNDTNNCDETKPYVKSGVNVYTDTKVEQEKLTLKYGKENKDKIRTVAIRPASIFGERDLLFIPTVLENGKKGKTKFYVGNGKNQMDYTYVKNVTHALILASTHLDKESVSGEAFFVTNQEPELFWGFMADILREFSLPTPKIGIPVQVMYIISYILLIVATILKVCGIKFDIPPQFELDKNALLVADRRFNSTKATRLFTYKPVYDMKEAKKRTVAYYKKLEEEKKQQKN
ncbi:hypothetical protein FDP41_000962 [Naegleria fowleri]|uniref:3-beta hydroxysteroid dehydrogenase/isomerase domain-containing protein n=1 Tax=Naegleria fowleri TaxID=5763 RepID=A0A6A5C3E1_NAEFO|nr:uncharacterized protein FDP41_000962 [Naegleria fowleri]KAF0979809.1 hypothetical protein FDP41_000962 [Naegleria fowleri]